MDKDCLVWRSSNLWISTMQVWTRQRVIAFLEASSSPSSHHAAKITLEKEKVLAKAFRPTWDICLMSGLEICRERVGSTKQKSWGTSKKMWDLEVCFGKKILLSFGRNKKPAIFGANKNPAKNKGSKSPTAQDLHQPTPPYLGHTMLPTSEISLRQRIENRGPGDGPAKKGFSQKGVLPKKGGKTLSSWWFEPTPLKNSSQIGNTSQIGSFPQVGGKIENIWNHHHLVVFFFNKSTWLFGSFGVFKGEPSKKKVKISKLQFLPQTKNTWKTTHLKSTLDPCPWQFDSIRIHTLPRSIKTTCSPTWHVYIDKTRKQWLTLHLSSEIYMKSQSQQKLCFNKNNLCMNYQELISIFPEPQRIV